MAKDKEPTFEEKVKSMTAREIIETMIEGLENPAVKIDMDYFGKYEEKSNTCFGCAATNTICQISGKNFSRDNIIGIARRARFIGSNIKFLDEFELAIDHLRSGCIRLYNEMAIALNIATIEEPEWWDEFNHYMDNDNYKELLPIYKKLAEYQDDNTVTP